MSTDGGSRRIRALTFGGGAFDTVMQLGVAHALLVRDGVPPDHVVGISVGAINAAALAEILQAGSDFDETNQQLAARVRKLREFVNAYIDIPSEIVESTFPDAFEVNAQKALQPLELPIHFAEERKSRQDANRSRAGLILLINHFLRIRLTVAVITKMIRRVLAIQQSHELRRPKVRVGSTRVWNYAGIWFATVCHAFAVSQVVGTLVYAAIVGRRQHEGQSAGQIILAFRPLRVVWNASKATVAYVLFMSLMLSPVMVVMRIPLPDWLFQFIDRGIWASTTFLRSLASRCWAFTTAHVDTLDWLLTVVFGGLWNVSHAMSSGLLKVTHNIAPLLTSGYIRQHSAPLMLATLIWLIALYLDLRFDARSRWVLLAYVITLFLTPWRIACLCLVLVAAGLWWIFVPRLPITTRILEHYEVGDGILSVDILLKELVDRFDPNYHGKHVVSEMIDTALQRADVVATNDNATRTRRVLREYRERQPSVHVAPVAANLSTGRLEILTESTSIVRALLAATATSPLFPASDIEEETPIPKLLSRLLLRKKRALRRSSTWYIDGLNISNEPIQPLLDYLRREFTTLTAKEAQNSILAEERARLDELRGATTIDVYPVSDLPVDQSELEIPGTYSTLVEVGLRALELKQLRDAAMERRLTRLYTSTLGPGSAFFEGKDSNEKPRVYIHAGIFPVELDRPAHVNRRIVRGASTDERKNILRAAVADGCRASLEAMLPIVLLDTKLLGEWAAQHIDPTLLAGVQDEGLFPSLLIEASRHATILDGELVSLTMRARDRSYSITLPKAGFERLLDIITPRCRSIIEQHGQVLPGNDPESGPGISEICKQCRLFREDTAATVVPVAAPPAELSASLDRTFDDRIRLRGRIERLQWPTWPKSTLDSTPVASDSRLPVGQTQTSMKYLWNEGWPSTRGASQAEQGATGSNRRPTVSFLFGGGVFRGVYHMGVMNALNEAGVQPDVVAGSSVGSIIAAMIASVFKEIDSTKRRLRVRSLAATFLAIDRFVLTDRLADFVRRFTLRGAEARFAPRDLDLVLRRYDIDFPGRFSKRARDVTAGLERLFYLSPFELFTIVRAARLQDFSCVLEEVVGDVQELLDRGAIGEEVLGSEPLALLIQQQVEDPLQQSLGTNGEVRFDSFLEGDRKMYFLATTTNLMRGALEIIGAPYTSTAYVSLRQGLLASSAFPAVFRPRHGWEVFLGDVRRDDLYIDGGVIDNLPLDAVARFLSRAARDGRIAARPIAAPHLLFTASLEVTRDVLPMDAKAIGQTRRNFFDVRRRAKTFNLNRKIDAYRSVQSRLDAVWASRHISPVWPLSLAVIAVKPNWLCNTFGFHPMLGFRRWKQAKSIGHGCATTLAELHANAVDHKSWVEAWGFEKLDFDESTSVRAPILGAMHDQRILVPRKDAENGQCWFRKNDHLCPFSKQWRLSNGQKDPKVRPEELGDLHVIYELCGQRTTHEPPER